MNTTTYHKVRDAAYAWADRQTAKGKHNAHFNLKKEVQRLEQSRSLTSSSSAAPEKAKKKRRPCYKPPYPGVFRPFGPSTRAFVRPRDTGVLDNVYDKDIVQSDSVPSFIPTGGHPLQGGSPAVLQSSALSSLRPGPHHWLFKIRGQ